MSSTQSSVVTLNKLFPLIIAVTSCMLCLLSSGMAFAWTSLALLTLQAKDSRIPMTPEQGSTMVSIMAVGGVLGPILFAYKVDRLGRRWMAFFACAFITIAWTVFIFSTEIWHLYLGRVIMGLGTGYGFSMVPLYVGEISETHIRGWLCVCGEFSFSLGYLFSYSVGPYLNCHTESLASVAFPLLGLVFFIWMPESPYFLVRQEKIDEAEKTLMWLRGETDIQNIQKEMILIKQFVATSPKRSFQKTLEELNLKSNRVAIIILTMLLMAQQFNVLGIMKNYYHMIIIETDMPLDPYLTALFIELLGVFVTFSCIFYVEKPGRRLQYLVTRGFTVICSIILGLYFMLKSEHLIGKHGSWMALITLVGLQVFSSLCVTLPIIASEMSSASIRSWYGGYKGVLVAIFNAVNAKVFQFVRDNVGTQYAFWLFSCIVATCWIVTFIILPETKGKTFFEIQDILSGKNKINVSVIYTEKFSIRDEAL